jgi:hypothetical protein
MTETVSRRLCAALLTLLIPADLGSELSSNKLDGLKPAQSDTTFVKQPDIDPWDRDPMPMYQGRPGIHYHLKVTTPDTTAEFYIHFGIP